MFSTYWVAVVKAAVLRSDETETTVVWGIKAAVVLAALFSPTIVGKLSALDVPMWVEVAPIAAWIFGYGTFTVWKQERERAESLQQRLTPQITVDPVVTAFDKRRRIVASVRVRNGGVEQLRNCTGKLLRMEARREGQRTAIDGASTYLRWSRGDGGGRAHSFQSEGAVDVIEIKKPYTGRLVTTPPESDGAAPSSAVGVKEHSQFVLTIEIAAENAAPVTHDYLCYIEPLGKVSTFDESGGLTDVELPNLVFKKLND
jgi:hypothetical protein